jgi:hypothetical protein
LLMRFHTFFQHELEGGPKSTESPRDPPLIPNRTLRRY